MSGLFLADSVSSVAGLIKYLMEIKENKNKRKELLELVLRQYYTEVYYNNKVFETIDVEKTKEGSKIEALKEIAPLLKNEYGKSIVTSLSFFSDSLSLIEKQARESEDAPDKGETNLISMIIFTVNRIDVLQNLAKLADERYLKDIKVFVRLKNIQNYTSEICKSFSKTLDDVMRIILV